MFPTMYLDLMPQFHTTSPAINISEDDKEYKVDVAAPGMTKDDFHISLNNDDIIISMEKTKDADVDVNDNKKYLRREFSYSRFEQHFTLPENVERTSISAQMKDGILHINLPKMTEQQRAEKTQFIEIR